MNTWMVACMELWVDELIHAWVDESMFGSALLL